MIDLELALQALHRAGVEFIIVGGVAVTIHGSARLTQDLKDFEAIAELEALREEARDRG